MVDIVNMVDNMDSEKNGGQHRNDEYAEGFGLASRPFRLDKLDLLGMVDTVDIVDMADMVDSMEILDKVGMVDSIDIVDSSIDMVIMEMTLGYLAPIDLSRFPLVLIGPNWPSLTLIELIYPDWPRMALIGPEKPWLELVQVGSHCPKLAPNSLNRPLLTLIVPTLPQLFLCS